MKKSDFSFHLPLELIAQYPLAQRTHSRMMVLEDGMVSHQQFFRLPQLLQAGDLLVFNNTRVIPARLLGHKDSGGKIEVLVERVLNEHHVLAHVRASKSPKVGSILKLEHAVELTVVGRQGDLYELASADPTPVIELLEQYGHIPLPPYIERQDESLDKERYQTVYAQQKGAVAAPTAGLHFDTALLETLRQQGIDFAYVTLHVGAGTFQPVRVDDIREHNMHAEYIEVSETVCQQVKKAKRVIAVGTTSVRCLETAAKEGVIKPYVGDTTIFIYPGYQFQCVDAMITNFHLSGSTLLMLVSAFAGYDNIKRAYDIAVAEKYRFFSYGDAMFLTKFKSPLSLAGEGEGEEWNLN